MSADEVKAAGSGRLNIVTGRLAQRAATPERINEPVSRRRRVGFPIINERDVAVMELGRVQRAIVPRPGESTLGGLSRGEEESKSGEARSKHDYARGKEKRGRTDAGTP